MNNTIETIRAEIERRKNYLKPQGGQGLILCEEMRKQLDSLLSFLDTLQEQPENDDASQEEIIGLSIMAYLETHIKKDKGLVLRGVTLKDAREWIRRQIAKLPSSNDELCSQYHPHWKSFQEQNDIIIKIKTAIASCNGFNREHRVEVFKLLDSLKFQPVCEELEEEMERFMSNLTEKKGVFPPLTRLGFRAIVRHFAQWQKEQMMKEAVEGVVISISDNGWESIRISKKIHECGDKVKLIFIKEEGK